MTHRLQTEFASAAGEASYVEKLRKHLETGYLEAAERILITDLASLESDLAQQCAAITRKQVTISGWPELIDAIVLFEGEPISGVAIGMANDPDFAFEGGQLQSPFMMLGLYTNESFAWSSASQAEILAQCNSNEPVWAGAEEDIEVYLEVDGLAAINTALIRHKHRFFPRDDNLPEVPLGHVEYVLASWLRALRFHQAVARELAEHGLPGNIPVVSGTVDMRPEVATVHYPEKTIEVAPVELASLITTSIPKRPAEIADMQGKNIRQQIAAANAEREQDPGFFARVFGRQ